MQNFVAAKDECIPYDIDVFLYTVHENHSLFMLYLLLVIYNIVRCNKRSTRDSYRGEDQGFPSPKLLAPKIFLNQIVKVINYDLQSCGYYYVMIW